MEKKFRLVMLLLIGKQLERFGTRRTINRKKNAFRDRIREFINDFYQTMLIAS